MQVEYAKLVLEELKRKNEIELTMSEIMDMKRIPSDNLRVYAYHKGSATILANIYPEHKIAEIKIIKWK